MSDSNSRPKPTAKQHLLLLPAQPEAASGTSTDWEGTCDRIEARMRENIRILEETNREWREGLRSLLQKIGDQQSRLEQNVMRLQASRPKARLKLIQGPKSAGQKPDSS